MHHQYEGMCSACPSQCPKLKFVHLAFYFIASTLEGFLWCVMWGCYILKLVLVIIVFLICFNWWSFVRTHIKQQCHPLITRYPADHSQSPVFLAQGFSTPSGLPISKHQHKSSLNMCQQSRALLSSLFLPHSLPFKWFLV